MASMADAPPVEPVMPGSAQLPAELARPARRRTLKRPAGADRDSTLERSTAPRMRSIRGPSIPRLVRPVVLATLAATLAGGVAFATILAGREQPEQHAPKIGPPASSEPSAFAELQTAFTAIQRQANAGAIAEQRASEQRRARHAPTQLHHTNLQRSRPAGSSSTHFTLAADHTAAQNPNTITTRPTPTADEIADSGATEPQQRQQPSSHAAASNQAASPPAGPSGLGQVVGKNCDPKCK